MSDDGPRPDERVDDLIFELIERTERGKWLPSWLVELGDGEGLQMLGRGLDE
jgi:hypothetical protein